MPYRNRRDRKPWNQRPEAKRPTRGWVYVSSSTERRLARRARRVGLSRHQLAEFIVSRVLDALGA